MAAGGESTKGVRSMLMILVATCQTTLDTLPVADYRVDAELTGLLEEVIERTRLELEALTDATVELR
jgi:hypothetical protein